MNDFLSNHGVSRKSSIKKKYNSSAAALYREVYLLLFTIECRIAAKIEGREPPTSLPEGEVVSEEEDLYVFFSVYYCSESTENEDPIQKELRLRAEAKERLRKKFGSGGLGSQAVGSSPISPGGYGNQPQKPQSSGDE